MTLRQISRRSSDVCSCHAASSPGAWRRAAKISGDPPFTAPLFTIATRDRNPANVARYATSRPPWCGTRYRSTGPIRLLGHSSANSGVPLKSPRSRKRNRPNCIIRRAAAAAGERRPDSAAVRPARSRRGDARVDRNVFGRVRELQGRHRRQDRLGREVRAREGLPEPAQAEPVVVVRVRAVRRADDRRLRGDRERRPRRHGGSAGGAQGLRAVLPGTTATTTHEAED